MTLSKLGISGLFESRKGTLSIIIITCSTAGLLLGKLDGTGYAAVMSVVAAIYNFTQHRCDIAAMGTTPAKAADPGA